MRNLLKPLVVALDLELTQPSKKIIQIGAVIGDITSGEVVSRFSVFANPGELLTEFIVKLTGIHQSDVDAAGTLHEAYASLAAWLHPYAAQRQLNPLTWGGGDSRELREALDLGEERWLFGRRWVDVKTVYTAWRHAQGKLGESGLATAMTKVGLVFRGRRHNALDDAENTFRMYCKLLHQFKRTD
jgi:inhibitor of KinA sporulation pathway (predicted exonuclease)